MGKEEIEILLVEDNPADVELTLLSFRKNHLANPIHVVNDGEEALDFLFARGAYAGRILGQRTLERLKLVLLDLKLPKVDGLEVLREVKGNPRLKAIPIVVLTSSLEEKDLVESYHLGVNSYIQKPVDFDKFQEVVKSLSFYWVLVNEAPRVAHAA
ncbi:MAG TPA: response regulator, partial [Candidatus Acidoferrales bacterium]|nr:response regulator [Candidatus Acidoferrales bacterium]